MRTVPETANRQDWPRLVAQTLNEAGRRIEGLETVPAVLQVKPGTAPTSPTEGTIYYDAATHKLQCWDGTAWNPLW